MKSDADPLGAAMHPVPQTEEYADVDLTVNGERRSLTVSTRRLLSDTLRHDLGLVGTHVGCEHGVCGACTVLVNGSPARSCLLLAVQCQGADIVTIEGVSPPDGSLTEVQAAFKEAGALQCGFCTPGFVIVVTALLAEADAGSPLTDQQIREQIAGNLCRCTGYQGIASAVARLLSARSARPVSRSTAPASCESP